MTHTVTDTLIRYAQKGYVTFIVLALCAVVPYLNTLGNEFVYDDHAYFEAWPGIREVDIQSYFAGDHPTGFQHVYRPVRSVMQGIVYDFTHTNPYGYHAFALGIHVLATILVYLIARKLLNHIAALAAAITFAVLPAHVESITFITASFNSAGVVLILLSFYFYMRYRESQARSYLIAAMLTAVVAYFSYETALVLPLLFALYDVCCTTNSIKSLRRGLPTYAGLIAAGVVFFVVRQNILQHFNNKSLLAPIEFGTRMLMQSKAYIEYIRVTVFGNPLSLYYAIPPSTSVDAGVVWGIVLLLGVLAVAIYAFNTKHRLVTFSILWFFVLLLPVSNVIQIASFANDNYLYAPSVAWCLLVGYGVSFWYHRTTDKPNLRAALLIVFALLSAYYGITTSTRNTDCKSDETLWLKTMQQHPTFERSYIQLASYYDRNGKYAEAKEYLAKVIDMNPDYSLSYVQLGDVFVHEANYEAAIRSYLRASELRGSYAPTYHGLGFAYLNSGRREEAKQSFQKAVALDPTLYNSILNLALIYLQESNYEVARIYFKKAVDINSSDYEALFGIAITSKELGDTATAKDYLTRTLLIKPNFTPAREMLEVLQ